MGKITTLLVATFVGRIAAPTSEPQPSVRFAPYLSADYSIGNRLETRGTLGSLEGMTFSGFGVNGGGRLTLTSSRLFTYAQLDFINLNNLFPREDDVAFMISQVSGWTADRLTLDAGFHYSETFDRNYGDHEPVHRVYAGFAEARANASKLDVGASAGLLHRDGNVTYENDLVVSMDVSCHFRWCAPYIGIGWTARKLWGPKGSAYAIPGQPLYASVGVCIAPFGRVSDFAARILIPRRISYRDPYIGW